MLLLVLVTALACSYLACHIQQHRREEAAIRELRALGANVTVQPVEDWICNCVVWRSVPYDTLTSIDLPGAHLPAAVSSLRECRQLQSFICRGATLDQSTMRVVADFPLLEKLDLAESTFVEDADNYIGECERLAHLNLSASNITDRTSVRIARLRKLKSLTLDDTSITDHGVAYLAALPDLVALGISATEIRGDGLRWLAENDNLACLNCDASPVDDRIALYLESASAIMKLGLSDTHISTGTLKSIAALPKLSFLRLQGVQLSDRALTALSSMHNLSALDLRRCGLEDADIPELLEVPAFRHIFISENGFTSEGMAVLSEHVRFREPHCDISSLLSEASHDASLAE
ncbi:hypothetical protein GF356_00260 [candidate division GN15 bacterium]|nr:hypothetical protein [candidate division GN15 bacterium]